MRRLLYPAGQGVLNSLGLLALRVVMGPAMALHGWPKIQAPLNWMGPDAPFPGVLQLLAAVAEFGGGIALTAGLLTRPAALMVGATMAVAAGQVHIPAGHPFVATTPGPSWELAGVYLGCSVLFLLAGPGFLSLDAGLFGPGKDSSR